MNEVTVYSLDICPICEIVKNNIKKMGIKFINKNMSDSDSIAELAINGVYTRNAPVIKLTIENEDIYFYDDMLLDGDNLKEELYNLILICV